MTTQLFSATVAEWEDAQDVINSHVSSSAYPLSELTARLDGELHHLVIDPSTRTVWWAWDGSPLGEEGWKVEQLSPRAAAEMLSPYVDLVQDKLDEVESIESAYAQGLGATVGQDQDALDEYAEVLRLDVAEDPATARGQIQARRDNLARQDALWQRCYANLVRDLAGTERGGKTRAAAVLGITDVQVGRIIADDDKRRRTTADAAETAARERRNLDEGHADQ